VGQAISTEHPAVVLRSRYRQLRALLTVALVAVVALAAAVVVLAVNDDIDVAIAPAVPVSAPSATGHDESSTAAAIGSAYNSPTRTGGPDESVVANAVSGD
jgi:thiamine monophosphate synthase